MSIAACIVKYLGVKNIKCKLFLLYKIGPNLFSYGRLFNFFNLPSPIQTVSHPCTIVLKSVLNCWRSLGLNGHPTEMLIVWHDTFMAHMWPFRFVGSQQSFFILQIAATTCYMPSVKALCKWGLTCLWELAKQNLLPLRWIAPIHRQSVSQGGRLVQFGATGVG